MNATLLAALTPTERHLVSQTEAAELNALTEDEALELHDRLRRARNKVMGQYRRGGARKVAEKGGRGKAKQTNSAAALKAEAFEEALARVSRRVAALAKQSAADLKAERLAAARGEAVTVKSAGAKKAPAVRSTQTAKKQAPVTKTKRVADSRAQGARRQAVRDNKGR